nr:MbcA/ParS/Xre antitoxin family protein [Raoultella terrigena]
MLTKNDVILQATALFEGNENATLKWCNESNRALQWKTPTEVIDSENGVLNVATLILRIEQGV